MAGEKADIHAIFDKAVALDSPEERARYLDQACGNDPKVRERVDALLRANTEAGGFFGGQSPDPLAAIDPTGTAIGPYKLLQQIGEGGMGVVYMAEQTEPVQRRVALKIIKPGMDSRQVIGRFEAERHALALMDHPNIAKVLDAGTTETGRPYFVMELVKGVSITQYCDEHHLTPRERLELFVPVCHAVQHAHQKGIIHRDIKPTNVLVAEYDDRPVPKIIDFGVAKAIEQRLTERTVFTQLGQVVGTIDYMSPEQAKLNQLDVDTRTDIYSLGVLLYELLTGETPFDRRRLRSAAFDELLRIIREEEPARPSHRLGSSESLPSIAANRHLDPWKLSTLIRGELDWIVMKALEKDRARRYETASALAADIQHYLADEAVAACPPSAAYRFKKFARRNKSLLATATLLMAVLLAATTVSVSQALRARRAERAAAERLAGEERALLEQSRHLWRSYLNEASALRRARRTGQRFDSLDRLRKAARMLPGLGLSEASTLALRNEWIACSALPLDVRPGKEVQFGGEVLAVDANFQHCLCRDPQGAVHLHRFADGKGVDWVAAHGDFAFAGWGHEFSPNGRFLAARSDSGFYRIWDLDQRRIVKDIPMAPGLYAVAFTPDGKSVAHGQEENRILFADLTTGAQGRALAAGAWPPRRLSFSPQGSHLAVVFGGIREVHIRDAQTGETTMLEHPAPIAFARWSFDGRLLAVSCEDFDIHVWDTDTWRRRVILRGHQWNGIGLIFWPRSYRLFSGAWDGTRRLWDASSGLELLRLPSFCWAVGFSPDERQMVIQAPQGANLWEADTSHIYRLLAISANRYAQRYGVAFHPNGRLLGCASDVGVHLWDLAADREIALLPIAECHGVVFHPADGSLIASGSRTLRQWPLKSEAPGRAVGLGPSRPLEDAITRATEGICLSPDGRFLAALSATGVIWRDRQTGRSKVSALAPDLTCSVSISPDGRWVGTGAASGAGFMLWDTQGDEHAATALWPEVTRFWAVFDATGRWLCVSTEAACRIYRVGVWDLVGQIAGKEGPGGKELRCGPAAFSPDSRMLAVRGGVGRVCLLDTATWSEMATLEPFEPRTMVAMAFAADGSRLAAATLNGGVQLWDLREIRRELGPLSLDWDMPPYPPPAWGADDEPLEITRLPEATGELICFEKHRETIWRVAFASDGRTALSLGGADVLLWEVQSGKVLRRFPEYADPKGKGARCGCFLPGGVPDGPLVVGGQDGAVRVLDVATGKEVQHFQAPQTVTDLAASPDGRRIVMGTADGSAIIWDVRTDREVSRYRLHSEVIRRLAVSPDGSRALTAAYDDVVCYWELETGRVLHRFTAPDSSVAFSPDGHYALLADAGELVLVDLDSGREVRRLHGHSAAIGAVAFGPDGRRAISGGADLTVRVWDVETGAELARFAGHKAQVTDVAISPDGRLALSASLRWDPTVRVWAIPDATPGALKPEP